MPKSTDGGNIQRNTMIALGWLIEAMVGPAIAVDGLGCTPTTPNSLAVQIGPGLICGQQTIDQTQFGAIPLGTDNVSPLVKMGILPSYNPATMLFQLATPTTTGQTINYLIECAYSEADGTPLVLPYFNANNPLQAFQGPAGSGTAVNTVRTQTVQLQLKAGVPATDGTQVTPLVDSGWTGIWVVTVKYGDTAINSSRIARYPNAPFLDNKLQNLQVLATGGPYAPINSPSFTGAPLAPTPPVGDASSLIPNTGWVATAILNVPHGFVPYGASSTFVVPAGVGAVRVVCTGGGGGGAGSASTAGGGGGGAGGTVEGFFSVTPGASILVTVGAGGAGGPAAANSVGSNGGSSSFGVLCSAFGGQGGSATPSGLTAGIGGSGSTTSGGVVIQGGDGQDGLAVTTGGPQSAGMGGASFWGGGGHQSTGPSAQGLAFGSGGGGRYYVTAVGGAGAGGLVTVSW